MFCPNCGKDCGEFKFCPECGRVLQDNGANQMAENRKKQMQAEGEVYCPKCLSRKYTANKESRRTIYYRSVFASLMQLANSLFLSYIEKKYGIRCTCLLCGNSWFPKLENLYERHKRIMQGFLKNDTVANLPGANNTYLQLFERHLTIYHFGKAKHIIPYEKLRKVDNRGSIGPVYGRISIRDLKHRYRVFPKTFNGAKKDRFTILYEPQYDKVYQQACYALKSIIEENQQAGLF